jgi:type I restriction enzyme S subunit
MKLGDLCEIVRGSSPRPKSDLRFYGGAIPRLMVADLTRDGMYVTPQIDSLTEEGAKQSRWMKKGDVVIAVSGNPGLPAILSTNACIHDGFVGFRNLRNDLAMNTYLYHFLQFNKENTHSQAVGAIFKNLSTDQIREWDIPLPPLSKQKQIEAILEKAEAAREKRRKAKELTEHFLQSAFLEMFGDPGTNPKGWETNSVGHVSDVKSGFAFKSQDYQDKGIRIVRISNFDGSSLRFENEPICLPEVFSQEYAEFLLRENDVLIAMSGATTGKLGFVERKDLPCLLNQRVGRFSITDPQKLLPQYLFHFLSLPLVKQRILDLAGGSAQPNISPSQLKELDIPLPSITTQHKFAALIDKIELLRAKQRESEKELENLFNSLMQKAFRGDLVG